MPYTSKTKSADENMQERNLKYIAVTRARKVLYLCNGELDEDEKKYYNQMTEEEIEQTRVIFEDDFDDEDYIQHLSAFPPNLTTICQYVIIYIGSEKYYEFLKTKE